MDRSLCVSTVFTAQILDMVGVRYRDVDRVLGDALRACESNIGRLSLRLTNYRMIGRRSLPGRSTENRGIPTVFRGSALREPTKRRIDLHDDQRKSGDH